MRVPSLDPHSAERLAVLGELRQAIEEDQLVLHYQPKISAAADWTQAQDRQSRFKPAGPCRREGGDHPCRQSEPRPYGW